MSATKRKPKLGRPPGKVTTANSVLVQMPDDLAQHVDACVSQSGVTRARWIRDALRDACLRQMARGAGLLP